MKANVSVDIQLHPCSEAAALKYFYLLLLLAESLASLLHGEGWLA